MTRKILTGAALGIVVLLIAGATIFLRTVDHQPESSDVVRVTLGDRSYAIPAELQPELFGVPSSLVGRALIGKHYKKIYIQAPDDPPAEVTTFSFSISEEILSALVKRDARFARLKVVNNLAFRTTVNSIQEDEQRLKEERAGATLGPDGLFLRKMSGERGFDLYSQGPLLFESSIKVICNRPKEAKLMEGCLAYGRISERSALRIWFKSSISPIPVWPEFFGTVEDFVHMLTIRDRDDQQ